ncbi:RNA-binding protein [Zostera marina]|uniref:RNA-binding protein n=1 Tax=Zostera marina TaxID=29655 RepID=A0A0K9NQX3_ZOSMR|nr:RNA-binding protein [Zostera marina]
MSPKKMLNSPRARYSRSLSPRRKHSKSKSLSKSPPPMKKGRSISKTPPRSRARSPSRSRSRSRSRGRSDTANPGNTLYVTGLSSRVVERDLKDHFSKEGKVIDCRLVVEPRTRISRGFAFVTMDTLEEADRAVRHLNHSVLEGRYITVEKSRRKRPRTPTPGNYLGMKSTRDGYNNGDFGRYRGANVRGDYGGGYRRSPRCSPYRGVREFSPRRSPYGGRSPRRSPYRGGRDYSPHNSPYGGGRSPRRSPYRGGRDYSPYRSPERGYNRYQNGYVR